MVLDPEKCFSGINIWHKTHKNIPTAVHTVPPDDEQKNAWNM
jgi:hypothetical protein